MGKILERISEIALNKSITIGALERSINASKGVISRAIANGTDIQNKWVVNIVENYPDINPDWLLTGRGSMLRTNEPTSDISSSYQSYNNNSPINSNEVIATLREQLIEKDKQINTLLSILEKKQTK